MRLARDVHCFRYGHLHSIGQLVLGDSGYSLRVAKLFCFQLIEFIQGIQAAAAGLAGHAVWIVKIENRLANRAALDTLIDRGQESAAPKALAASGVRSS